MVNRMTMPQFILECLQKDISDPKTLSVLENVLRLFKQRLEELYPYILSPKETDDLGFWYYNRHDFSHIERVMSFLEAITKGITLNSLEYYILYLAAMGHDVGMSIPEIDVKKAYAKIFRKQKLNTTKFWRQIHAFRSGQVINNILKPYVDGFYFTESLKAAIEEISSTHSRMETSGRIEIRVGDCSFVVRRGLLCGLLRIADLCDNDKRRLPEVDIVAKVLALSALEGEPYLTSVEHYLRRYLIREVIARTEDGEIKILVTLDNMWRHLKINVPNNSGEIVAEEALYRILEEFVKELGVPHNKDWLVKHTAIDVENIISREAISKELLNEEGVQVQWVVQFMGPISQLEKSDEIIRWETKAEKYFDEYIEKKPVKLPMHIFLPEAIPKVINFINREKDLREGEGILRNGKALLIHGLPGVGKTTLAIKIASSFAPKITDAFFYTFHEFSSVEEVIGHIGIKLKEQGNTIAYNISLNTEVSRNRRALDIIGHIDDFLPVYSV